MALSSVFSEAGAPISHEPLNSLQQSFFSDKIGNHIGCRRRNLNSVLAVFRRAEAEGIEGPTASSAEVFLKTVMEFAGIFIDFG